MPIVALPNSSFMFKRAELSKNFTELLGKPRENLVPIVFPCHFDISRKIE